MKYANFMIENLLKEEGGHNQQQSSTKSSENANFEAAATFYIANLPSAEWKMSNNDFINQNGNIVESENGKLGDESECFRPFCKVKGNTAVFYTITFCLLAQKTFPFSLQFLW